MKVLRTVCGILTILLFFVILFQSCLVGAGNTLTASGELSGTTGFVGEGVLLECLKSNKVEKVLSVSRKTTGRTHPKLEELIIPNFKD